MYTTGGFIIIIIIYIAIVALTRTVGSVYPKNNRMCLLLSRGALWLFSAAVVAAPGVGRLGRPPAQKKWAPGAPHAVLPSEVC